MWRNRFISFCLLFLLCWAVSGCVSKRAEKTSTGYAIEINLIEGRIGDSLYLCRYHGYKAMRIDSLLVINEQPLIFGGKKDLLAGMYTVKSKENSDKDIDFFISNGAPQHFNITYTPAIGMPSVKVKGSPENEAFADYVSFSTLKEQEKLHLESYFKDPSLPPDSAVVLLQRISSLKQEMKDRNAAVEREYPGTTFALFAKIIQELEVSLPIIPPTVADRDSFTRAYYFDFYNKHYLDNVDFSDERFIRMPFMINMLYFYFTRIVSPEAAALNERVDFVMEKAKANRSVYEFIVRNLYDLFRTESYPEMEKVAIHIGDNYVMNDSGNWKDKEYVARMSVAIRAAKLNPLGQQATDLHLQDFDGENISLYDVSAPYTLVYLYDPDCGSCRIITPEVYKIYLRYREKGFRVYAVYIESNKKQWKKYIDEQHFEWINVWDATGSENLYDKYDIHAIPTMLLLNKDKMVIGKDLMPDVLDYMLERLLDDTADTRG